MKIFSLLVALLLLPFDLAQAATRVVSPTGSGSACTLASPCTLTFVQTVWTAGDLIQLRAGDYGSVGINNPPNGTTIDTLIDSGQSIVRSFGITTRSNVTFRGNSSRNFVVRGTQTWGDIGISINDGNFLRFENIEILNNEHGLLMGPINNSSFINLNVHDNGHINGKSICDVSNDGGPFESTPGKCHGMYIAGYSGNANNVIDGGEYHDNEAYGIHLYTQATIVRNARVYNNGRGGGGYGIAMFYSAGNPGNNKVYNNIVYGNPNAAGIWSTTPTAEIYNNTLYNNTNGPGICVTDQGATVTNNLAIANGAANQIAVGSQCGNTIPPVGPVTQTTNITTGTAGAHFVNAGAGNFTLLSSSAAKDSGTSLSATMTTDAIGVSRPQLPPGGVGSCANPSCWDIGATELVQVGGPTAPAVTITTTNPSSVTKSAFTISGTVADPDSPTGSLTWSNNRGGSGVCTGWFTWSCSISGLTGLSIGDNIITVSANDGVLIDSKTIGVLYAPTFPGATLVLSHGYDANTGTTAADSSTNNNFGTLNGSTLPTWTPGKYGSALLYGGSPADVIVSDSNSLDLTQSLTLEMWVFQTEDTTGYRTLLQKNGNPSPPYALFASSNICGAGFPGGFIIINNDGNPINVCDSTARLALNTWEHVAMTYDGQTLRWYRNGVAQTCPTCIVTVSSLTNIGIMEPTGATLTIGAEQDGNFFRGKIDETKIYNYARDAGQIVTDRDTPITPLAPPSQVKVSSGAVQKFTSGTTKKVSQ